MTDQDASTALENSPEPTHRLLNRELSWLDFNDRVLDLATEPGIPLLERVKFCAIFYILAGRQNDNYGLAI